jgi:hypothetical protein
MLYHRTSTDPHSYVIGVGEFQRQDFVCLKLRRFLLPFLLFMALFIIIIEKTKKGCAGEQNKTILSDPLQLLLF